MDSTKIITERFANISALQKKLSSESGEFIFRGMASSDWRIQTSIDRLLCHTRKNNNNPLLSEANQNTFVEFAAQTKFIQTRVQ